ncbi:ATP-binding protein [Persicobacter diffluens]|uniref:histidine kinase n=1 Tax=Persicobacter diffluens TaxID=981 RepID=A0AAN4VUU6_9BACT|nr:hypothetical protein PEDI_06800 [Persicobacter diffluens]
MLKNFISKIQHHFFPDVKGLSTETLHEIRLVITFIVFGYSLQLILGAILFSTGNYLIGAVLMGSTFLLIPVYFLMKAQRITEIKTGLISVALITNIALELIYGGNVGVEYLFIAAIAVVFLVFKREESKAQLFILIAVLVCFFVVNLFTIPLEYQTPLSPVEKQWQRIGYGVCAVLMSFLGLKNLQKNYRSTLEKEETATKEARKLSMELYETNQELEASMEKIQEHALKQSKFFNTLSHELRTPLNGIVGLVSVLKEKGCQNEKSTINSLAYSATVLLHLVNDVLDLAKFDDRDIPINPQPFELSILGKEILNIHQISADKKGLTTQLEIDESIPKLLLFDGPRLSQCINNLINNAIKFTNEGFVKLSIQKIKQTDAKVRVRFAIEDSGKGIAPEKKDIIFRPFEQETENVYKEFGGTGLGLSISQKILHAMGGDLLFESEVGKGTTFFFELEFDESPEHSSTPETIEEVQIENLNILGVDDNPINLMVLKKLLSRAGCKVFTASHGQDAVNKIKEKPDIDLILMDLQMPVMDGYEATQVLRDQGYKRPIIALSATLPSNLENMKDKGFTDALVKPFDITKLKEVISQSTSSKK